MRPFCRLSKMLYGSFVVEAGSGGDGAEVRLLASSVHIILFDIVPELS